MPVCCHTPNTPPVGSAAMAMRPLFGMSMGPAKIEPPCSLISLAVASTSSLAR